MQYKIWSTVEHSFVKGCAPKLWDRSWYQKFRTFVVSSDEDEDDYEEPTSPRARQPWDLDKCMYIVLTANFVLVCIETFYDLSDYDEPACLDTLELIFSFVYLGQFFLKILVMSFQEYWASFSNRFDFFTTWLLLCTGLIERIWGGEIATYANVFRLFRLLRMVRNLKNLK